MAKLFGTPLKKGISASIAVAVLAVGGYWGIQQGSKPSVNPLSIAVLPFTNITGDPAQSYVADGLTNRVTSDLARIQDAVVTDAGMVLPYKDKTAIVQQVGKELGVRFILQGDVQRSADKVLINAKLTDTVSNKQLWSESFEGNMSDLFSLQDMVTHRISGSLGSQMLIVAASESEKRKTDPEASDLILRGRALMAKGVDTETLKQRVELFRQALTLEPDNTQAMAGLSRGLSRLAVSSYEPREKEKMLIEARDLALKVKEIDPKDKDIYFSFYIFSLLRDDLVGAIESAEKFLSLNPKEKHSYTFVGQTLILSGNSGQAIEVFKKGISLDPLNPVGPTLASMGRAQLILGDSDASITSFLKAIQVNPKVDVAWANLAVAYAMKGEPEKATAAVAEVLKLSPRWNLSSIGLIPMSASPPAYKEWYENKLLPAYRKAGLPE